MFKISEEIIVIQAEATDPITTGVVFWSHDKGTAKLLFQLKKVTVSQTLAKGTIVPICLVFNGGRHIYHAVIEDAVNGIVSIVLEDNILGYVGRVEGSIYIELPDSRSLDTAGRFTFDIKRSPIDEKVPELEDYFWQGFNEIIQESKRLIDQVESNCKTVLNDLSSKVTSLENQTSDIKSKQAEILKSIEEHDVFTKQESSANVIDQVIGKESNIEATSLDFKDKVSGSLVENVNKIASTQYTSLLPPSNGTWLEFPQANIDKVKALDKELFLRNEKANGYMQQVLICYDVLAYLINRLGENFFTDRGAKEVSSQVTVIRSMISGIAGNVWGYGSGPNGNKMTFQVWTHVRNKWEGPLTTTNSTVTKIKRSVGSTNDFIDSTGKMYFLVNAEPGDGVTASTLNIDYVSLQFDLNVSANDYIKSMMAQNHVKNLATQEEAETGTDNAKTMTPLRTAQQINKKAVTIAENQTIGGIKNFKDGLMINDDLVVSKNDHSVFILDSTTSSVIADGKLYFILHGSLVVVEGSIKFKTGVAYVAMISSSLPNSMIATISNGILVGSAGNDSAKGIFVENGTKNIKASSVFVPNEWFTCNGVYWAGKE